MYHVMNRGERREDVFQDDEDRQHILSTLGEACRMTGWHVYRTQIKGTHRDGMLREANREAMDMPPLRGWTIRRRPFYKHDAPTGLAFV